MATYRLRPNYDKEEEIFHKVSGVYVTTREIVHLYKTLKVKFADRVIA